MDIVGDRKFVEVPGGKTHDLPPLLVRTAPRVNRLDRVVGMATNIVESEDLMAEFDPDARRKMDLALNLVDRYFGFVCHWQWGDGILEWIRQCEITFGSRTELRNLMHNDVWPHAGRASFVQLLEDKKVDTKGVDIERAVGMRLTFRQPPPISCFSNQFLFYLNTTIANTAYRTWSHMSALPVSSLPPERFAFEVYSMDPR